jgi:hypothetical protein
MKNVILFIIPFVIFVDALRTQSLSCKMTLKTLHDFDSSHINFLAKCIKNKKKPNLKLLLNDIMEGECKL